jgi:serine/threonine protein kinase
MQSDRWRQIEELFNAALEHPSGDRAAFLERTCGTDKELMGDVQSLLVAERRAGRFLETCGPEQPPALNSADRIGLQLGPYLIVSLLGAGGMGEVYRATDIRLDRSVAVKLLTHRLAQDSCAVARFQREARAASALNHPNICTLYDIGDYDGQPFLVLELLEGQTLKERMSTRRLSLPEVVDFGIQVADGLEAAHARGIVHRDIKPGNIFITTREQAKILDFGLVKLVRDQEPLAADSPKAPSFYADAATILPVMGTLAYMSPEQVRGEGINRQSDLFSFGVVLYELATGALPFEDTRSTILNRAPQAPRKLNPALPPALERIILKALEKEKIDRYKSAAEMREDLESVRHRPRLRWLMGAAAGLVVAGGVLFAARSEWLGGRNTTVDLIPRQITANAAEDPVQRASVSSDGAYVAYTDLTGINIRRVDTGETRVIPPPPNYCYR